MRALHYLRAGKAVPREVLSECGPATFALATLDAKQSPPKASAAAEPGSVALVVKSPPSATDAASTKAERAADEKVGGSEVAAAERARVAVALVLSDMVHHIARRPLVSPK